jgi:hypothetical protein
LAKTLVIELSDELEQQLGIQAIKQKTSLEDIVLEWLTRSVRLIDETEGDPIAPLLGTLTADVTDLGEQHDTYLGNTLQQELRHAG